MDVPRNMLWRRRGRKCVNALIHPSLRPAELGKIIITICCGVLANAVTAGATGHCRHPGVGTFRRNVRVWAAGVANQGAASYFALPETRVFEL